MGRIRSICWYNVCCVVLVSEFQFFLSFFLLSFICGKFRQSWPPPNLCPVSHDEENIRFFLVLLKRFINAFCFNVDSLVVASSELCDEMQWCTGCCGYWPTVSWPFYVLIACDLFLYVKTAVRTLSGLNICWKAIVRYFEARDFWDVKTNCGWFFRVECRGKQVPLKLGYQTTKLHGGEY